jgi:hypothetical protein
VNVSPGFGCSQARKVARCMHELLLHAEGDARARGMVRDWLALLDEALSDDELLCDVLGSEPLGRGCNHFCNPNG